MTEDVPLGLSRRGLARLSFAFNTNSDLKLKGEASFDQPNFTQTIRDFEQSANVGGHINNFDLGGIVGAGVEVAVSDYMLYFDARLTFGLTSIDEIGDKSVRKEVISVFAGFGIPFGSEKD